jgi:predicted ester cyclase
MGVTDNKTLVQRWWEDGYNGRDLSLIDVLFAATYIHHSNDNALDRAAFREAAAAFQHSFPDSSVRIEQLIGEGDLVVVRWRFSGTHTIDGTRWGSATGRFLNFPSTWVCLVQDGTIREDWETWDMRGVVERLQSKGPA